jgi:hypothetical protein
MTNKLIVNLLGSRTEMATLLKLLPSLLCFFPPQNSREWSNPGRNWNQPLSSIANIAHQVLLIPWDLSSCATARYSICTNALHNNTHGEPRAPSQTSPALRTTAHNPPFHCFPRPGVHGPSLQAWCSWPKCVGLWILLVVRFD